MPKSFGDAMKTTWVVQGIHAITILKTGDDDVVISTHLLFYITFITAVSMNMINISLVRDMNSIVYNVSILA